MNIERLLSQEPFNKWVGNFLRDYTTGCSRNQPRAIGARGFTTDMDIVSMFMDIMLKDSVDGFLNLEELAKIFYAWYEENSTYHNDFAPPKATLTYLLERKYNFTRYQGSWGFRGVELAVTTIEEAKELINAHRDLLQYRLPDFEVELDSDAEVRRRKLELEAIERNKALGVTNE